MPTYSWTETDQLRDFGLGIPTGLSLSEPFPRMPEMNGKVVLITGGGDGAGAVLGWVYAMSGAYVWLVDIKGDNAAVVAGSIRNAGYSATGMQCDVTNRAQVQDVIAHIIGSSDYVDVLVANAGVIRDKWFQDLTFEDIDFVTGVHQGGFVNFLVPLYSHWLKRDRGQAIFVSSGAALYGNGKQFAYILGKGGPTDAIQAIAFEADGRRKKQPDSKISAHVICQSGLTAMSRDTVKPEQWASPELSSTVAATAPMFVALSTDDIGVQFNGQYFQRRGFDWQLADPAGNPRAVLKGDRIWTPGELVAKLPQLYPHRREIGVYAAVKRGVPEGTPTFS